jgi:hypothetical protein
LKKALVVSDTHGNNENLHRVLKLHPDAEFVIHCGDVEDGEDDIRVSVRKPLYMVAGNNDYFNALPRELEENVFGHHILITHGHNYRVSVSPEMLRQEAVARDCDIAFYGHTHRPEVSYGNGCICVNPGSLSYPRQEGRKPSYIIWEVDDKGQEHFTIAYLNNGMW